MKSKMFMYKKTYYLAERRSTHSVYRGLILAMMSGFFYSSGSAIVKNLKDIHPGQLSLYRYLAIFTFSLPEAVMCQQKILVPSDKRLLLFLRGVFGATNSFCNFFAFRHLPLGESAVIIFSLPVFVTIAARIFLKEPCGYFQSSTVLTSLVGIILTSRVPLLLSENTKVYSREYIVGLASAFVSLISGTAQCIVLRKLEGLHHSIIMFHYGWIAVVESVILTAVIGKFGWHACGLEAFLIVILGLFSYSGQTSLTMALLCEAAGPACTVASAVAIVMGFTWQTFLFHDDPDVYSVGALLVLLSVIFVALTKWVSDLPPESAYRQKLRWMLK